MKSDVQSGVVRAGSLYTTKEARSRLGIGEWGWRQMRRAGLRTFRQGNRTYVLGDDLLAFFRGRR